MRAVIVANGKMEIPPNFRTEIQPPSVIIAADGGTNNCKILDILPHVIIGDMDSMQPGDINSYQAKGVEILQYPAHKDETDLELTLRYVKEKHYEDVIILGGLGQRWDMSIANILLMAHPQFEELNIHLFDGAYELLLLRAGKHYTIHGFRGDTLSLLPLAGDVQGIITGGLEYPLKNEVLHFGATRGISNVFIQEEAQIKFQRGLLLCVKTSVNRPLIPFIERVTI